VKLSDQNVNNFSVPTTTRKQPTIRLDVLPFLLPLLAPPLHLDVVVVEVVAGKVEVVLLVVASLVEAARTADVAPVAAVALNAPTPTNNNNGNFMAYIPVFSNSPSNLTTILPPTFQGTQARKAITAKATVYPPITYLYCCYSYSL
jgi:hypothetical protein